MELSSCPTWRAAYPVEKAVLHWSIQQGSYISLIPEDELTGHSAGQLVGLLETLLQQSELGLFLHDCSMWARRSQARLQDAVKSRLTMVDMMGYGDPSSFRPLIYPYASDFYFGSNSEGKLESQQFRHDRRAFIVATIPFSRTNSIFSELFIRDRGSRCSSVDLKEKATSGRPLHSAQGRPGVWYRSKMFILSRIQVSLGGRLREPPGRILKRYYDTSIQL